MESTKQEETINELKAALAELESDEGLEMFVEGHGLQSRYFAFHGSRTNWRSTTICHMRGCSPTRTPRTWTPRGSVGATVTPEGELSADEATPSFGADGLMPV